MLIVDVFVFYFGRYLSGGSLQESITYTKDEYTSALLTLLKWANPVNDLGHFWYLYAYLLIVLALPVINAFVCYLDANPFAQKWFCLITLLLFILNDFCFNGTFSFSHHGITAAIPGSIEMIWGHILYRNREKLRFKLSAFVWLLLFFVVMIIRWQFQMIQYTKSGSTHFLYWYTSFWYYMRFVMKSNHLSRIQKNTIAKLSH